MSPIKREIVMIDETITQFVREAQTGDRQAFGELAERFQNMVYGIALRTLKHPSEAREAAQDILMQAMRKIDQLREPERFASWLRQIAVRMSLNRAMRRPRETTRSPESLTDVRTVPETPLDDVLKCERKERVWNGLKRLRELDRRTLVAFYIDGQSLREMSDEFQSPIGTIKRRLHTARHRLREELEDLSPVA